MKKCSKCKAEKPKSDFYSSRNSRDGLASQCRLCVSEYGRRHHANRVLQIHGSKTCSHCKVDKPRTEFYKGVGSDGRQSRCKECCRVTQQSRREQVQQTYNRRNKLKRTYGLSLEDYARMLAGQFGVCAICGTDKPGGKGGKHFHVDHDHATGEVRGLLCTNCNTGLGKFKDNADMLELAIEYLRRNESAQLAA